VRHLTIQSQRTLAACQSASMPWVETSCGGFRTFDCVKLVEWHACTYMDSDFGEARDVFRIFSPGTKTAGSEETVAGRGRRVRDEIEVLERRCSRSPPWEEHWADLAVDEVEDPRLKREAIIKVLEVSNPPKYEIMRIVCAALARVA